MLFFKNDCYFNNHSSYWLRFWSRQPSYILNTQTHKNKHTHSRTQIHAHTFKNIQQHFQSAPFSFFSSTRACVKHIPQLTELFCWNGKIEIKIRQNGSSNFSQLLRMFSPPFYKFNPSLFVSKHFSDEKMFSSFLALIRLKTKQNKESILTFREKLKGFQALEE